MTAESFRSDEVHTASQQRPRRVKDNFQLKIKRNYVLRNLVDGHFEMSKKLQI